MVIQKYPRYRAARRAVQLKIFTGRMQTICMRPARYASFLKDQSSGLTNTSCSALAAYAVIVSGLLGMVNVYVWELLV